jgi:WD40 repeat protein
LADHQGELLVGFLRDQASKRTKVTLWKRSTGNQQTSFELPDEAELAYNAVALSSTGHWLATRTWNGPVRLFDLTAKPPRQVSETPDLECIDLAFSPDGKALAAACQFGRVAVIEVPSGKRLPDLIGEESIKLWAQQVAFSPDGKLLAASNDVGLVRVFDFATRKVVANLVGHQGEINDLAFFPDSRRLAVAGVGPVRIWDTEIEQELLSLPAGEKTYGIVLAPDGSTLYACDGEGTVFVWRAE